MSEAFTSGPGYEVFNLLANGAQSTQLSKDETKVFVSTDTGDILVYDLASRTLLQTINVAAELFELTITDDAATGYVIGAETSGGTRVIYEVNLATGASSILPNTSGLGASDVEHVDGDLLLISGPPSYIYNLATQQATQSFDPGFSTNAVIVENDDLVLIGDTDVTGGSLQLYDEALGRVIATGSTFNGPGPLGGGNGVLAVSAEAGLIAQYVVQSGLKVYDLNFNVVYAERFWGFYEDGFAFSSDGSFLLALRDGVITTFDTTTWQSRQTFSVNGGGFAAGLRSSGSNGDAVHVTSDDQTIIVTSLGGGYVHIISLADTLGSDPGVFGTEGDDNLQAVVGQDVDGLGGNDRLEIDFRAATEGVDADFRGLETGPVTIAGGTISNIENIQLIEGSEFADFIAPYQDFPIGSATINGYGGDDEIIISMAIGSFGPSVDGGDGDDVIDAGSIFQQTFLSGGDGNDMITTGRNSQSFGAGGDGDDTIISYGSASGGAGNDTIELLSAGNATPIRVSANGGEGDDTISVDLSDPFSGPPEARIEGGSGGDTLTGGNGNDDITSFEFDSNSTSAPDNGTEQDTLIGGAGSDHLFAGIGDNVDGGADSDRITLFLGSSQTGVTLNADDLVGGPSVVLGGTIQNIESVVRIEGSEFADTISLGAAASAPGSSRTQVQGRGGDDDFTNNGGAATFYGEEGNDRFRVTDNAGSGSFFGGNGIDTFDASARTTGLTIALSDNPSSSFGGSSDVNEQVEEVENVEGGAGNDVITGSVVANVINGNGGDDVIDGGFGDNILNGGAGVDELRFLFANAPTTVDLRVTSAQQTGTGLNTVSGFENVTGSRSGDTLTGDSGANLIQGLEGNDKIDGAGGDDDLRGGGGTDTLLFASATQGITVNLALTTAQNTGVGLVTLSSFENIEGTAFDDTITGSTGSNVITGGNGDDTIDGGAGFDRAVFAGNFANFAVLESVNGIYTVAGNGVDSVTSVEILRFDDIDVQLDLGGGLAIDPGLDDPNTFMVNIRDFDGNDIGAGQHWVRIGAADANLDGSDDIIFVNRVNGRFAEVGVDENGLVQFDNHGAGGDTRVVGIYIDPLVQSGDVEQGSPFDSQQRFQNDLFIGNIKEVLGSQDYDGDGFAEIYFALTDGTAYLRALMHADGNIQYANYQSQEQVIEYLNSQGFGEETYGTWFPASGSGAESSDTGAAYAMDASQLLYARHEMIQPEFFG